MMPPAPDAGAACPPSPTADEWISDFEMERAITNMVGTRGGTTWTSSQTEGMASVTVVMVPARCGSGSAMRFAGSGFAAARPPFVHAQLMTGTRFADVSAYRGVRMALRASTAQTVRLKIPDRFTGRAGNSCTTCTNHFSATVQVTTSFSVFTFLFAELQQNAAGADLRPRLDTTGLWALEIFPAATTGAFELFVDDVVLVR